MPTIRITLTPRQWELYDGPGSAAAARALNAATAAAIPVALEAFQRLQDRDEALDDAIDTCVMPVAARHAHVGAMDSEPPQHARDAIRRHLGWD